MDLYSAVDKSRVNNRVIYVASSALDMVDNEIPPNGLLTFTRVIPVILFARLLHTSG